MKNNKAQIVGEIFKYSLVGIFSVVVLIFGYKMIDLVKERACKTEIAKFEIDLKGIDKGLRYGAKEVQSHDVPCKVDKIYFFDLSRSINPENFKDVPIIEDSLKSGGNNNVFLVKGGEVKRSFYAGNLEMSYPYHLCFVPKFDKISFFAEGAGKSARITGSCGQPECTFIPVDISLEDAREVISEGIGSGCQDCRNDLDNSKIELTRQNVEILRKFIFCENFTEVEIKIKQKNGHDVRDFRFYEFIPKTCIDDLNRYLAERLPSDVIIKNDPLIAWHFDELSQEQSVSYKLSAELNDECRQLIKGLGVAQFVEGESQSISGRMQRQNLQSGITGQEEPNDELETESSRRNRGENSGNRECIPNARKACVEDRIYWFDSCGRRGALHYDCRSGNLARNQCRNAQCCIGNFFCQTP